VAQREFTDERGVTWVATAVYPDPPDRRETIRRSDDQGPPEDEERRTGYDRREIPFSYVSPGLERGWLLFTSTLDERRRLFPIPPEWEDASLEQLRVWCRGAIVPAAARRPVR
jgi:hypothetical protein